MLFKYMVFFYPESSYTVPLIQNWTIVIYNDSVVDSKTHLPNAPVETYTGPPANGIDYFNPVFTFQPPVILSPGTYWVSVYLNINSTSSRGWTFETLNSPSPIGHPWTAYDSTGYVLGTKEKWVTCSSIGVSDEQDLQFIIYGNTAVTSGSTTTRITGYQTTSPITSHMLTTQAVPVASTANPTTHARLTTGLSSSSSLSTSSTSSNSNGTASTTSASVSGSSIIRLYVMEGMIILLAVIMIVV